MFGTGFQPGGGGLDDLASAAFGLHQAGEGVGANEDEPQTPSLRRNGETTPGPHNDEPDGREEEEEVLPNAEQKDPANWPPPDKVKEAKLPMVRLMDKNSSSHRICSTFLSSTVGCLPKTSPHMENCGRL